MKMRCCRRCQTYYTCDTKWYRGEKHEEDICCPRCDYFKICRKENKKKNNPS